MEKRKRKSNDHAKSFLIFLLAVSFFAAVCFFVVRLAEKKEAQVKPVPEPATVTVYAGVGRKGGSTLSLQSECALLFDPETGETLYAKNADKKAFPASLTKMMTVLVAIEEAQELDVPVTLEYEDFAGLYEQNASMAGFAVGETVTLRDVVYAALLPSGAEAANALARVTAGDISSFLELMNRRAEELGMKNSHFTNVTGLHDEQHYSAAEDLSLLLCAALKNEAFVTAFSAERYVTSKTEQHHDGILVSSTSIPRLSFLGREREPITGCKTGYTDEAGLCLASVAEREGVKRALITTGASGGSNTEPLNFLDAYKLYEKCLPAA